MKSKRIVSQDIAKGIGITVIVANHAVQPTFLPGAIIVIFFGCVLPFFYFISGYNYKPSDLTWKKQLWRRTKQIFIPFFILSLIVFVVMGAYFAIREPENIYAIVKSYIDFWISEPGANLLGIDNPQIYFRRLFGPCWFLQVLIVANFFFYPLVNYSKKSTKAMLSCVIGLIFITIICINFNIELPWWLQDAPLVAAVMLLAQYFKKISFLKDKPDNVKLTVINCIVYLFISAIFEIKYNAIGLFAAANMGVNFGLFDALMFVFFAICGTYFLINFSLLIKKIPKVSNFFIWFGKNSMFILIIHYCFIHVWKDIFMLEQKNAANGFFTNNFDPMELVVFILTIICLVISIALFNRIKIAMAKSKNK